MLIDLSFLNLGEQWPPKSEIERLKLYQHNHALFENGHADVYKDAFKRIQRVVGNFEDVISYEVIANYQKLITLKLADLLMGEEPNIAAGEHDSAEQISVETIKENVDLHNTAYESVIDVSRYGDGVLMLYKDGDKGMIDVTQPSIWFPVVDPDNIKKIKLHVLAWVVSTGTQGNETYTLRAQIHEPGRYEEREYQLLKSLMGYTINRLTMGGTFVQTGLDDFAIVQVPNVLTSDRVHGMDDYSDIDSIISEILVRISQISRILDKHADPSVTGPTSVLEQDPQTGEWKLKLGNFFPRDSKDDAEVKYLVWDGQLEAAFKQLELLINILHAISEVGSSLLGDKGDEAGNAPSGTSLRFRLISPLAKARRVSMRFKTALVKAIKLCSQLGGKGIVPLTDTPISITFNDGLPDDPKEQADIMQIRSGNKATLSVQTMLQRYEGMTPEDADIELKQIQDEEEAANPMLSIKTPFNGDNKPKGNE